MAEESRSTFDFSDQFGSDPITRRYSRTGSTDIRLAEAGAREAAATRELAEANLAKVQAELTAQLAPMKTGVEMITTMSDLVKQRTALQDAAAIKRGATAISEGLNNPDLDLKSLGQLVSGSNANGLRDADTRVRALSTMLDKFRQSTDTASSPYEVDAVFSLVPATVAGEPEFQAARTNALAQASLRQGVLKSSAAEPDLGPVPLTPEGLIDVPKAEINIAGKMGAQQRRKEAQENLRFVQPAIERLERRELEGSLTNLERLELKNLQSSASNLLSQILEGVPQEGGEDTSDLDASIGGGVTTPPTTTTAEPLAAAPAPAPSAPAPAVPTPEKPPLTLEEEARQAAEQGKQAAARASIAPQREQRRAAQAQRIEVAKRRLNLGNLREEKSRLLKSIYDNEKGQKLKRGLAPDSDIVKRVQARIAEIDTELPQK